MDTQYCLQCNLSQTKHDQYGAKYCYCFFNPDKGRLVAEIKECPKDRKENNMKAPDKIYVHVRTEPRPSITFSEVLEKNSTNEEYIRKGALLEWAKEKESSVLTLIAKLAYKTMINKIEQI